MRAPLPVRVFGWAAAVLGDQSDPARETFAAAYAETRARGRGPAARIWLRAMLDLAAAPFRDTSLFRMAGQDLRWSVRAIRRRAGASAVIVISIGAAIGANTGAFTVIDAFMLRDWGSRGIDRVVRVREVYGRPGEAPDVRGFTLGNLASWQRENTVFDAMAAGLGASATLFDHGRADRVSAGLVTANFFDVIGIQPALGRVFTAEEDTPARRDAVILGDALWRSHFAADPGVLGTAVQLNGRPRIVVGVMPPGFKHPYQSDLWVPLGDPRDPTNRTGVYAPARLKTGVDAAAADRALNQMAARLWEKDRDPNVPSGARVTLLKPEMLGRLDAVLYGLAAAAGLVLLIAVANVSNLLLAQGLERAQESAIRTSLGASRGRIIRQHLIHSLVLVAGGAVLGVLLASWAAPRLVALSPVYGAGEFDITPRLDWLTLAWTMALTVGAGLICGILPAIASVRQGAAAGLRESGRLRTLSASQRRVLRALAIAEIALAAVFVAGGGAMAADWRAMARDDWGLDRRHALTFDLAFARDRLPDAASRARFLDRALDGVRALPGVTSAGATSTPPFYAGTEAQRFVVEGLTPPASGYVVAHTRTITPGYFAAAGIPLVAGRDFSPADRDGAPPVVIVSASLAARYWPQQSALGKRLRATAAGSDAPWLEVVGVVGSLRENDDADIPASDAWYVPHLQASAGPLLDMTVVARTAGDPAAIAGPVREVIAGLDARQPVSDLMTLEARFARFTATERLSTGLTAVLGLVGLALAAVGVYAVLAFGTARRLPELAIRSALGARPLQMARLVSAEACALGAAGGVVGAVAQSALRASGALPFWPRAGGWWVTAGSLAVLAVAVLCSVGPARRASRVSLTIR